MLLEKDSDQKLPTRVVAQAGGHKPEQILAVGSDGRPAAGLRVSSDRLDQVALDEHVGLRLSAAGYDTVGYDLRSFGRSGGRTRSYVDRFDRFLDDLEDQVRINIEVDARISYDLLMNVFSPDTPLHDGAVIVQGDRIAAISGFAPMMLITRRRL